MKKIPSLMNIEIWEEGYSATGESASAYYLGTYDAPDFDEAVKMYLADHPEKVKNYTYGSLTGHHKIWGCRLYDNEQDARKSFN